MSCRDARRAECRGRVHQEEISRHKGGQLEVIANGKGSSAMSIASSHAGAERSTTRCLKMTLGPSLTFANHSIFSHPLRHRLASDIERVPGCHREWRPGT